MNSLDLAGRVAIVTGGARGIGRATATRMLRSGASVALWDADTTALARTAAALSAEHPGRVSESVVDVTDRASIEAALSNAVSRHHGIDILINSAGILGPSAATVDYPERDFRRVIEIDLIGVFNCCQIVAPTLVQRGWGRVVNVASLAGKEGTPMTSAYDAAKAGVIALTKAMGKELAMTGVLVNCVAPAAIETDMVADAAPENVRLMLEKSPMRRLGTVDECAAMICWLASDDCSFSTGAVFDLSGGRTVY
ncbi:MAG: SDR family oxidoreductase [Alphaproteobacteria bacterium]|nr:SDR family oxidoreductase [Alphaproteobacteria bacterium]